MSVSEKFKGFCNNLTIQNRTTISQRYKAITKRLNLDYWDWDNDTSFSRYVGSYGRGTAIRGFSDLDMIFQLPDTVKLRFNNHIYNGQSALLQEVKKAIQKTYPTTDVGGDGQVVAINFTDGVRFEIVPAFKNTDESFTFPNANDGGSWKKTDPLPEISAVSTRDSITKGNMKRLCRMARAWKSNWGVPIGGLLIDTLADRFLSNWGYSTESYLYYDWMVRDFFLMLSKEDPNKSYWYALGSSQFIWRRGKFEAVAKKNYKLAIEAIEYEKADRDWSANNKWREIFGTSFPN